MGIASGVTQRARGAWAGIKETFAEFYADDPFWFGALITGVLLTLGKFLIGLYLGHASFASAFGAAASVVVLMVWVYYASLILFFGAEVTQVYCRRVHGLLPPASKHAVEQPR